MQIHPATLKERMAKPQKFLRRCTIFLAASLAWNRSVNPAEGSASLADFNARFTSARAVQEVHVCRWEFSRRF